MALARGRVLTRYFFELCGEKYVFRAVDSEHAFRHCYRIFNERQRCFYESGRLDEFDKGNVELRSHEGVLYSSDVRSFRYPTIFRSAYIKKDLFKE